MAGSRGCVLRAFSAAPGLHGPAAQPSVWDCCLGARSPWPGLVSCPPWNELQWPAARLLGWC